MRGIFTQISPRRLHIIYILIFYISLSLSFSLSLSLSLSHSLSLSLSLSQSFSTFLSFSSLPHTLYLFCYPSHFLSCSNDAPLTYFTISCIKPFCPPLTLSLCVSLCLSLSPSLYLSVRLSVRLSIYRFITLPPLPSDSLSQCSSLFGSVNFPYCCVVSRDTAFLVLCRKL